MHRTLLLSCLLAGVLGDASCIRCLTSGQSRSVTLSRAAPCSQGLAMVSPRRSLSLAFFSPSKKDTKDSMPKVSATPKSPQSEGQKVEIPFLPPEMNEKVKSVLQTLDGVLGNLKETLGKSEAASKVGHKFVEVVDTARVAALGGLSVVAKGLGDANKVFDEAAGRVKGFIDQERNTIPQLETYYTKGDEIVDEFMVKAKSMLQVAIKATGDIAKKIPVNKLNLGELEPLWDETVKFFREAKPNAVVDRLRDAVPFLDDKVIDVENAWCSFEFDHPRMSEYVVTGGAGSAAYIATAAFAQRFLKTAGLSNLASVGRPAATFGAFTVVLAGLFAGEAARSAALWRRPRMPKTLAATLPPIKLKRTFSDRATDVILALFVYKNILGGRYRSIAPSDLTRPGVFAREWVPAAGESYATYGQRVRIGKIGWKRGCHSCGSRLPGGFLGVSKSWVCDHQPPNKLVAMGEDQRFYPHCRPCSQLQSLVLRGLREPLRLHWLTSEVLLGPIFLSVKPALAMARDSVKQASEILTSDSNWSEEFAKREESRKKEQAKLNKAKPQPTPKTAPVQKTAPVRKTAPVKLVPKKTMRPEQSVWNFGDRVTTKPSSKSRGFDWKTADMLD